LLLTNPVEDVEIVRREWHNLEIVRRQKYSSAIPHDYGPGGPDPDSDSNGDEDEGYHLWLILKKISRELIRPAVRRCSAGRRPPIRSGSPTFPKAAHFDSNLEHVRHFLQADRPLAVSAGIDPSEISDIGVELPFNVGGCADSGGLDESQRVESEPRRGVYFEPQIDNQEDLQRHRPAPSDTPYTRPFRETSYTVFPFEIDENAVYTRSVPKERGVGHSLPASQDSPVTDPNYHGRLLIFIDIAGYLRYGQQTASESHRHLLNASHNFTLSSRHQTQRGHPVKRKIQVILDI
jgi:hypothetical protein